jgi:hypothetical protein
MSSGPLRPGGSLGIMYSMPSKLTPCPEKKNGNNVFSGADSSTGTKPASRIIDADAALRTAGCEVIRAEKRSGTTTQGREALRTVLEFLHAGDVLMVTRIDCLARSIGDLQDIVRTVRARRAVLKATEQPIDTGTAAGKCFLDRAHLPSSRPTSGGSASSRT